MTAVLAVDIGGTKITAARVELAEGQSRPQVLASRTVATPAREGAPAVLRAAADALQRVEADARDTGAGPAAGIGVATAGVVDVHRGRITHATDAITGWAGADVRAACTGITPGPVAVLNDVHAHALGEATFGCGRSTGGTLLQVAVGTGIGGAAVIGGKVLTGAHGAAGHLGHMAVAEAEGVPCPCGRTGHLEGLASGPGILALAQRRGAAARAVEDGRALAAAARAGDAAALEAYRIAGTATGRVIGSVLNLLDVPLVALSGGVARACPAWAEALRAAALAEEMDVLAGTPIVAAELGDDAALLGAAESVRRML